MSVVTAACPIWRRITIASGPVARSRGDLVTIRLLGWGRIASAGRFSIASPGTSPHEQKAD